jgi:hypothetical protein
MTRTRVGLAFLAAAALGALVPAPSLRAETDETVFLRDLMCRTIGCPNDGDRKCGDVKGEVKDPTGRGTLSVTWYCYDRTKGTGTGEGGGGEAEI